MRFLHTADWHVGRTLRGRSRMEEFEAALATVVDIATDEQVDAVLVAGDIYDQRSVTADADRLVFETFATLYDRGIPVVAVAGNHDSGVRFDAFATLLRYIGTSVVGRVRAPEQGGIVEIGSKDRRDTALIACIPFVSPRRFSDAAGLFESVAGGYVDFDENMGRLLAAYEHSFRRDAVNIVMGHMFVAGSQPSGSEREITIGGDYAVAPMRLPATASYIALGHIHKPQKAPGAPAEARYSGSLLQLDFGERGQDKSVFVIEATAGKPPVVRPVPVSVGRRLLDVQGTLDELTKIADQVGDAYLRVTVVVDRPVPGIADQVREILPHSLDVRLLLPAPESEEPKQSLRGLSPKEQFAAYYQAAHAVDPGDALNQAFDRVYEEVSG